MCSIFLHFLKKTSSSQTIIHFIFMQLQFTSRRHLLIILCLLLSGYVPVAAQPTGVGAVAIVPGQGGLLNTSTLSRGPDPSRRYQRVMAVYTPTDAQGLGGGQLRSLGFQLRTPAASAVSGTLRVWLRNTTDVNYSLTTNWAYSLQNPIAFQQVYNGPLTIPAQAGWYDVVFSTPFAFAGSGNGFYLAYEWETTTPNSASGAYECFDRLPQSLRGGTGTTAFPAQIATVSAYRPLLRVGYTTPGADAVVVQIYGPGELARQGCLAPFPVQARIRNAGTVPLVNLPVTFTPGVGASGSAYTRVVASLSVGAEAVVSLPALEAGTATGGFARYRVSVPADANGANDSRADSAYITAQALSYTTGFPTAAIGTSGVGFAAPAANNGTLLCRYPLQAPALISSVRVRIYNTTANVGNVVFGVVLDEQGRLLGRSADVTLTAVTNGSWLALPLTAPVRASGRVFFAGIAQTRPAVPGNYYFPLATQAENPVRDSAYYSAVGDSALVGLKPPREVRGLGRFMIETSLQTAPLATQRIATQEVGVWPNPTHGALQVALSVGVVGSFNASWLNTTGQLVRFVPALQPLSNGTAMLNIADLRPGLYLLKLTGSGWSVAHRVLVE